MKLVLTIGAGLLAATLFCGYASGQSAPPRSLFSNFPAKTLARAPGGAVLPSGLPSVQGFRDTTPGVRHNFRGPNVIPIAPALPAPPMSPQIVVMPLVEQPLTLPVPHALTTAPENLPLQPTADAPQPSQLPIVPRVSPPLPAAISTLPPPGQTVPPRISPALPTDADTPTPQSETGEANGVDGGMGTTGPN